MERSEAFIQDGAGTCALQLMDPGPTPFLPEHLPCDISNGRVKSPSPGSSHKCLLSIYMFQAGDQPLPTPLPDLPPWYDHSFLDNDRSG